MVGYEILFCDSHIWFGLDFMLDVLMFLIQPSPFVAPSGCFYSFIYDSHWQSLQQYHKTHMNLCSDLQIWISLIWTMVVRWQMIWQWFKITTKIAITPLYRAKSVPNFPKWLRFQSRSSDKGHNHGCGKKVYIAPWRKIKQSNSPSPFDIKLDFYVEDVAL